MVRVEVRGELLRWARDRAGLAMEDLATKFPKLELWERGEARPTLKQLESYATATRAPVGYLFLQTPPDERVPIPDFRTMGGRTVTRPSPDLLDTIYACQRRQDWYRENAALTGATPIEFVGSMTTDTPVVEAAAGIRAALGFDLAVQRRCPTWTDALRTFISKADDAGILVMCSGVVMNNNYRKLNPEEFRGFALSDELAPLIFINGADSKAAQMFTLAHELAHIWIGETALSDTTVASRNQNAVETWCNRVAAEMLVPLAALREELRRHEALETSMQRLAVRFKVSTLVVLQRLRDARQLSWDDFNAAYAAERRRLAALPKSASGGDFYLTTAVRYSRRFTRALVESTIEGRTLYRDAFRLLGISKVETFHDLGRSLNFGV